MVDLVDVQALGPRGAYRSRGRVTLPDVRGADAAELSLVPDLYVGRAMRALRGAATPTPDERAAALRRAAGLFEHGSPGGLTAEEYAGAVSRVGGLPIGYARQAVTTVARRLARAADAAGYARPTGAVHDWDDAATSGGGAVWTRRGDVFAVHLAGNHPGSQSLWPEALALGYRVAVRPSRREPFTAHRTVSALRDSGFGPDQVVLLPTDHQVADAVLRDADLGMVYGGDDVVRKYGAGTRVLPQGPGRSKILLTADVDWREHVDTLVESIAGQGGAGCVNTTAVLVEGDAAAVAEALAERLSALPSVPPEDEKALLPVHPARSAAAIGRHLEARARGTRPWLADVVDDLGDGSAVLRPAVHEVDSADAPQLGAELPFPCVWVGPWDRASGSVPLRDSLVVTALTEDRDLIAGLVAEPTVGNVHLTGHPTNEMVHGVPHDGYLGEFLMRTTGVIR